MCDSTGGASSLIINSICTLVGGLGGAALTAWGGFRGGKKLIDLTQRNSIDLVNQTHANDTALMRQQEFNIGAATFRAAFTDAIYVLRRGVKYGRVDANGVLTEPIFAGHEKAKIIFEPYLPSTDLPDFNTAWDNYRNYENRYSMNESLHFTTSNEKCQYCLDFIEVLLKFAEPK